MPKIQASSVFWLQCILQGKTPFTKTRIARQPFDRLKNRNQIWIDNIKTINQPPKILLWLNYKLSRSLVKVPQIQSFTSVFWQESTLQGLTPLGKTPIARQPLVGLENRDQIWIEDFKSVNLKQNLAFQLNCGENESSFSGGPVYSSSHLTGSLKGKMAWP